MTMYQDVVRDFIRRTRSNLELVRKHAKDADRQGLASEEREAFEITQLINSMLGLLVFPQQKYFNAIPRTPLAQLTADGWPRVRAIDGFPDVETLHDLLRYLRNAVSHFNLEFTEHNGHIRGVRLWNNNAKGDTTWKAALSLEELDAIIERFCDLLESELAGQTSTGSKA